jgi:hypothetical protein
MKSKKKKESGKMRNKIFSSFLLLAFLNFIAGCYSFQPVTVNEYKQIEEEDGKQNEINVITKDSKKYYFSYSNYYIENDTLYGKESVTELPFEGRFAFSEIKSIQVESVFYTVSQYQRIEEESGKPYVIYLTKTDFTIYQLMENDYYIKNDILYGKGKLILDEEELINRNIALSDIESIEIKFISLLKRISWGIVFFIIIPLTLIYVTWTN